MLQVSLMSLAIYRIPCQKLTSTIEFPANTQSYILRLQNLARNSTINFGSSFPCRTSLSNLRILISSTFRSCLFVSVLACIGLYGPKNLLNLTLSSPSTAPTNLVRRRLVGGRDILDVSGNRLVGRSATRLHAQAPGAGRKALQLARSKESCILLYWPIWNSTNWNFEFKG